MNPFSHLSPEMLIGLALQFIIAIFSLGVYAATVRFLSKSVGEVKKKVGEHDEQLEQHEAKLARLDERTQHIGVSR